MSSGAALLLTCEFPIVQLQATEGIGAVEQHVPLRVDRLQLLQTGFTPPETLAKRQKCVSLVRQRQTMVSAFARLPCRRNIPGLGEVDVVASWPRQPYYGILNTPGVELPSDVHR